MAIIRTTEWRSTRSVNDSDSLIRSALSAISMEPNGSIGSIEAKSKRSLVKNRWAATISAQIEPRQGGSSVRWTVDMLGNKHFAILDEIADHLPDEMLDDQGIRQAVQNLGLHRIFGKKEIRHLHNVLSVDEDVVALGTGQYASKMGIAALTNERIFFFEKSLMNAESLDEFPLSSVSSLSVQKGRSGETLTIHSTGHNVEIKMGHGHADAFVRGLRDARSLARNPVSPQANDPHTDPIAQIEKLATLRDKGLINDEEFEKKKAELLGRL